MTSLDEATLENTPWFSFEGEMLECKVLKVYDGDTIIIAFMYNNRVYKKKCRLNGIDTPEIRTFNEEEKKAGFKVKDFVSDLIANKKIYVKCGGWSKYGDLLGVIYLSNDTNTQSINELLLTKGLANPYSGGKKLDWNF